MTALYKSLPRRRLVDAVRSTLVVKDLGRKLLSSIAMATPHDEELSLDHCKTSSDTLKNLKPFRDMPGPRGLPLLGNALKYSSIGPYSFEKILDNRFSYMKKYGKIYKEKLGPMWMVNLFDPTDIATMFRLEGQYPSRGKIASLEVTYLKRNNKLVGFAFLDGPEWTRQRGCIQQLMMHPTTAMQYLKYQMPVARDFAEYLGGVRKEDGLVPDLYENLFKYTMESIGAVCFGDRIGSFNGVGTSNQEAVEDVQKLSAAISETFKCFRSCMFAVPWYRHFRTPTYQRFERAANTMRSIMGKHVNAAERRVGQVPSAKLHTAKFSTSGGGCPFSAAFGQMEETMVEEEEKSACVFEMLRRDPRVSKELAVNLVMALFRTGIDSTGNALAFFLHNLANNPEKQETLYQEIQQSLPFGELPTPETLKDMTYMKACLKESFRLHYPVFGGSGRVMPEDTEFSGYNVPRGTFIFANMAVMSRMDEYFPSPEEYHPERWLRDSRASLGTTWSTDAGFLSLPFSHGGRACPGKRFSEQSLYTAVIAILQKYRLESDSKDIGMIHMPFTIPDRPLNIRFVTRQPESVIASNIIRVCPHHRT